MKVNIDEIIEDLDDIEARLLNSRVEGYEAWSEDIHEISEALGMIRAERRK